MHDAAIVPRRYAPEHATTLTQAGVHPVLARVFAARGVQSTAQLDTQLKTLLPFEQLKNVQRAASILADAIAAQKRLLIVGDYDADGATACAVGVRALRQFGARVDYLVPNRFEYGYGLTPEIVAVAAEQQPELLITVDNGIASVDGVRAARALGIPVLITDHHLPGAQLPDALCIVNPNQADCAFASKSLAGVGVMFYLMLALRAELRRRDHFANSAEPNLAALLDIVALGTVADVVALDFNNRILVSQGLARIRAGRGCTGITQLLRIGGRDPGAATTHDLGFLVGPRLNAAGRLQDISLGIECLLSDDPLRALEIARQLDNLNRERRGIEAQMHESALAALDAQIDATRTSITMFQPQWHQGIVGLLASRIKERFHRPVIAFARGSGGELKGSGRAIAGLHLRDALDLIDKQHPDLLIKFGGHAAAAGVSIRESDIARFEDAFEQVATQLLSPADLQRVVETDGELSTRDISFSLAQQLHQQAWGQGFPSPSFDQVFSVEDQRIVGERHSRLRLRPSDGNGRVLDAMLFSHAEPLPPRIHGAYELSLRSYEGLQSLDLVLRHWREVT